MRREEKEEIAGIVREEIARLEEQIPALEAKVSPIAPDCSLGRLTRMEAMGEKEVNERVLEQSRLRLTRLKNTLGRIDREGFGLCIECEEPIALERLRLRPESLRCMECEEAKED